MPESVGDAEVSVSGDLSSFKRFLNQIKNGLDALARGDIDIAIEAVDKASDDIRDVKDKVETLDADQASVDLDAQDDASGDIKKVDKRVDDLDSEKATVDLDAQDQATKKSRNVTDALRKLHGDKAEVKLRADDQATSKINSVRGALGKLMQYAAAAGGIYMLVRGIRALSEATIGGAADLEGYRNTLTTVMGSAEEAAGMMNWVVNFAKSTPFEIPGLMEAAVRLQAYGIDARDVMGTLGDTASAMGKDVMEAVEALADAQTGEFERLKEFGVKALEVRQEHLEQFGLSADALGKTMLMYTDKNGKEAVKVVDRNNREMITSNLMAIWNERYAGAMEKQSQSWKGIISNIKDTVSQGFAKVGEAILPKVKEIAQGVLDMLSSDKFEAFFTGLGNAALSIVPAITTLVDSFMDFAVSSGLLEGLTGILGKLGSTIADVFTSIFDALKPLVPAIINLGNLFADFFSIFRMAEADLIATIFAGLAPMLESAIKAAQEMMPSFEAVLQLFGALLNLLEPIVKFFGEINGILMEVSAKILGTVLSPLQWLADALGLNADEARGAKAAFSDYMQTVADSTAGVSKLYGEYDKLSQSLASGTLSAEEAAQAQQRMLELSSQIGDQAPGLIAGWDSQGNAILKNRDACQNYIDTLSGLNDAETKAAISKADLNGKMQIYFGKLGQAAGAMESYQNAVNTVTQQLTPLVGESQALAMAQTLVTDGVQNSQAKIFDLARAANLTDDEIANLESQILACAANLPGLDKGFGDLQNTMSGAGTKIIELAAIAGREGRIIPQVILDGLNSNIEPIRLAAEQAFGAYLEGLVSQAGPISDETKAMVDDCVSQLANATPEMRQQAVNNFSAYIDAQVAQGKISVEQAQQLKQNIITALEAYAESYGKGSGQGQGVADGLTSQQPTAQNSAQGIWDTISSIIGVPVHPQLGEIKGNPVDVARNAWSAIQNYLNFNPVSAVFGPPKTKNSPLKQHPSSKGAGEYIGAGVLVGLRDFLSGNIANPVVALSVLKTLRTSVDADIAGSISSAPAFNVRGDIPMAKAGSTQVIHLATGPWNFPNVRTGADAEDLLNESAARAAHLARNMP